MRMTNTNQNLGEQIEKLIQEHIVASRASAQEAIVRAFASATATTSTTRRVRRAAGKKRASAEIEALGQRFYTAVCAKPGETMTVLAGEVGASAHELHRPVTLLRRSRRVRAVGERHLTRYFPMANGAG